MEKLSEKFREKNRWCLLTRAQVVAEAVRLAEAYEAEQEKQIAELGERLSSLLNYREHRAVPCDALLTEQYQAVSDHVYLLQSQLAVHPLELAQLQERAARCTALEKAAAEVVAELEEQLQILGVQERLARESNGYLQDVARAAKDDLRDLQSQLAWKPVSDGLPTEPGWYEIASTRKQAVDVFCLTQLTDGLWWFLRDVRCESPLERYPAADIYRRLELPEAK